MIIIHSIVFAGTVYFRPIPTKISHCCTSSFPATAIYNPGPFLQRNPSHKSDFTMLAILCRKIWPERIAFLKNRYSSLLGSQTAV